MALSWVLDGTSIRYTATPSRDEKLLFMSLFLEAFARTDYRLFTEAPLDSGYTHPSLSVEVVFMGVIFDLPPGHRADVEGVDMILVKVDVSGAKMHILATAKARMLKMPPETLPASEPQ